MGVGADARRIFGTVASRRVPAIAIICLITLGAGGSRPATANLLQQEAPLVATGGVSNSQLGNASALSADGTTALIGGFNDNTQHGAAWVLTHAGANWIQQGSKLTPSDSGAGQLYFGTGVALSADGNTALISGPSNNGDEGAVWVFTRSGTTWSQQGPKITPSDPIGGATRFGASVALSADGTTALVGAATNGIAGGAWVFTRSGSVWTQRGGRLTPNDETGAGQFGASVALSANGAVALIGGPDDNLGNGAVWSFTRTGSTWSQQGSKLIPSDAQPPSLPYHESFGDSIALSADGTTAVIGAPLDDTFVGAVWAFTRAGSTWAQEGPKLTTSDGGQASLGSTVAIQADGSSALAAGPGYSKGVGAAWLFERSGSTWSREPRVTAAGLPAAGSFGFGLSMSADGGVALIPSYSAGQVRAFARTRSVSVARLGAGSGSVQGGLLSCPATCSAEFTQGADVSLTASPAAGSVFAGWAGACSGLGSCTFRVGTRDESVTATFNRSVTQPAPATSAASEPAPDVSPPPASAGSTVPRPLAGLPTLATSRRLLGLFPPRFATRVLLRAARGRLGLLIGLVLAPGAPAGTAVRVRCLADCGEPGRTLLRATLTRQNRGRPVPLRAPIALSRSTIIEIRLTHSGYTGRLSRFGFVKRRGSVRARLVGTGCLTSAGNAPTACSIGG